MKEGAKASSSNVSWHHQPVTAMLLPIIDATNKIKGATQLRIYLILTQFLLLGMIAGAYATLQWPVYIVQFNSFSLVVCQMFRFLKATPEELQASSERSSSKPNQRKPTAAKAKARERARANDKADSHTHRTATAAKPLAIANEAMDTSTPGSTPIKSPPKKKQAAREQPPAEGPPRRVLFKSPDPNEAKQVLDLKKVPCKL